MANPLDILLNFTVNNAGALKGVAGLTAAIGSLAAAMTVAAKEAIKFDKSLQGIASITDLTKKEINSLRASIMELSRMDDISDSADNLAQAVSELAGSGFEKLSDAMRVATAASKAAAAGNVETMVSAKALAGVINSYSLTSKDASEISDKLFTIVRDGAVSFEALSGNLSGLLPIASSVGISLDEMGAAIITMSKTSMSMAQIETSLAGLFRQLAAATPEAKKFAKAMGVEIGEEALEKGLIPVLQNLYKATGGSLELIRKIIPDTEGANAALILMKNNTEGLSDAMDSMGHSVGNTQKALSAQTESFAFQIKKLSNEFTNLKIEVGQYVAEGILPLIKWLRQLLEDLSYVDDIIKSNIGAIKEIYQAIVAFKEGVIDTIPGLRTIRNAISDLIDYLSKFTGDLNLAVEAWRTFRDLLGAEIREQKLKELGKNTEALTNKFKKLSDAQIKALSTDELKEYSRAFAQYSTFISKELTTGAGSKYRKKGTELGILANEKEQQDAAKKIEAENKALAAKNNARDLINLNVKTGIVKKEKKAVEDMTSDILRLRKDMIEQEKKITLNDLQYKIWSVTEKYKEEKSQIEKAIKLKQATEADIVKLGRVAALELQGIWKEHNDKLKADEKESSDKRKAEKEQALQEQREAYKEYIVGVKDDLDDLFKSEAENINKTRELLEQSSQDKKQAHENYINGITSALARYTGQIGESIASLFSLKSGMEAVNVELDKQIELIESNADLTVKQKAELTESAEATAKYKKDLMGFSQAIEVVGNSLSGIISAYSAYNEKVKDGTANTSDFAEMLKRQAAALPGIGQQMAAFTGWITDLFGMGEAKKKEDLIKNTMSDIRELMKSGTAAYNEQQKEKADITNKINDQIADKEKDVIKRAYEFKKDLIDKEHNSKKEKAKEEISWLDAEINKLKSAITGIDDELAKRRQAQASSQETASAFSKARQEQLGKLPADFFRTPVDKFDIENEAAIADLQQKFSTGAIDLDTLNKELMGLAVKRNIFYQHITDSLQKGTKENLEWQKKTNGAYEDYANLQQESTVKQLEDQRAIYDSQMEGFESLKNTELDNIAQIETAHQTAILNLESQWTRPSGAFRVSMEEAILSVGGKMDAELNQFIERSKVAISQMQLEKQVKQSSFSGGMGGLGGSSGSATTAALSAIKIPVPMPGGGVMYIEPFKSGASGSGSGAYPSFAGRGAPNFGGMPGFADGGIMNASKKGTPAMLHNSEMILNPFQQAKLFNMINAGGGGGINVVINTGAVNNQGDINKIANAVSNVIKRDYLRK